MGKMNRVISFKALIADDTQHTIPLSTNTGGTGYRIKTLRGMSNAPGAADGEHIIKVYKIEQTAVDGVIDLSDNTLIASLYYTNRTDTLHSNENVIVQDNEVFNQDIYITHTDIRGSASGNYYLELEPMKLDLNEQTVATLKDIRNIGAQ
jgi:hypothetical protein